MVFPISPSWGISSSAISQRFAAASAPSSALRTLPESEPPAKSCRAEAQATATEQAVSAAEMASGPDFMGGGGH